MFVEGLNGSVENIALKDGGNGDEFPSRVIRPAVAPISKRGSRDTEERGFRLGSDDRRIVSAEVSHHVKLRCSPLYV